MKTENTDDSKRQKINIELGEKEAEGIYANLAIIAHSPAEFVIDFTRVLPGVPKSKVFARIIMTPAHIKMFSDALADNVEKFERQYGEIKTSPFAGAYPAIPDDADTIN